MSFARRRFVSNSTTGFASKNRHAQRDHHGFSILDTIVAIAAFTVVAAVVIPSVLTEYETTRLSDCKAELDRMKAVAYDLGNGARPPTPTEFWAVGFPDAREGDYYYIVDEGAAMGHGNDLDGCDEDDPGDSPHSLGAGIKFVVFCDHDHGQLGKYVYATDRDPPTVVPVDGPDPGYQAWLIEAKTDGSPIEGKEPRKPGQPRK
jgi:hypothetical protein